MGDHEARIRTLEEWREKTERELLEMREEQRRLNERIDALERSRAPIEDRVIKGIAAKLDEAAARSDAALIKDLEEAGVRHRLLGTVLGSLSRAREIGVRKGVALARGKA